VSYGERRRRAAELAEQAGLEGLLVTPGGDLAYLTGYAPLPLERLTVLIVRPSRDPLMLVPQLECPGAAAAPGATGIELVGWLDGDDPYLAAQRFLGPGRWAVTDQTWASHVMGLQRAAGDQVFEAASEALPLLRAVKDADELAALRAAGAAADAAFSDMVVMPFEGRRESQVAADLADRLRAHGHQSADFTIVGSGPNGASPQHEAGERVIVADDVVVLDFGGHMDGYCSDITRTVVVRGPSTEQAEVHAVVRAAQQAAFDAVAPGVACQDVDRAARAVIEEAGYGERFAHRTGHGIGLEVHEPPYIVEGNVTALQPGMTFSIEPGIYLTERFGVRIEDIVAVTADGAKRFNEAPRDLAIVG
jgi:D-alanyl-D-alanine dipeptidase